MSAKRLTASRTVRAYFCHFLLFIFAAGHALTLTYTSGLVNKAHYERWPLRGDTASYWLRDLKIAEQAELVGLRRAVLVEAAGNPRDPLRTIGYAFTGLRSLQSWNGHLYFSAFAALMFFWMFGSCLHRRSGSLMYALAAPAALLLAAGLLDPLYGTPSKLPDLPAAMLLGAALFALVRGRDGHRTWWSVLAGGLAGLASLTRYHAFIYGVFMLGPIVSIYAFGRHLELGRRPLEIFRRDHAIDFLRLHIPFFASLGVTAGLFIVWWARDTFNFYAVAGYALNHGVGTAFATTGWKLVFQFLGVPALTALLLVMAGYVATCRHELKTADWVDHLSVAWAAAACILLILVVMRVMDDVSQTYYMAPGLALLALAPLAIRRSGDPADRDAIRGAWRPRPLTIFAAIAGPVLYASVAGSYYMYLSSEQLRYPRPKEQEIKRFNSELAELMAVTAFRPPRAQKVPRLDANFDYYTRYMVPEIIMRHGRMTRAANLFQIRKSQWQLSGQGEETAAKKWIMRTLLAEVDVFAALEDYSSAQVDDVLKDDYTRRLAEHVAREMASNPQCWERRGSVESPYGRVAVYDNLARRNVQSGCPIPQSTGG